MHLLHIVMARLSPAIHENKNVDARHKAGHDARWMSELPLAIARTFFHKDPLAGLDPAIHIFTPARASLDKTWMAGSSPAKGIWAM